MQREAGKSLDMGGARGVDTVQQQEKHKAWDQCFILTLEVRLEASARLETSDGPEGKNYKITKKNKHSSGQEARAKKQRR